MPEIILTNHVRQRAKERGIYLGDLDKTVRFPDKIIQSKSSSFKKHIKNFGSYQIVIPIKRQGNSWITISVWKNTNQYPKTSKSTHNQFFLEKMINNLLLKLEKIFSRRSQ